MCGIFGIIGKYDDDRAGRALAALGHRGPDHVGFFSDENLFLGQTRLSVIDLSEKAHQPMCGGGGRYTCVMNGEVYNYRELRSELADDYVFHTQSDTEVLLAAYIHWGPIFLEKLRGMFAFAIWDSERRELFVARDRFGKKPLYWTAHNGSFIFASEIQAITGMMERTPEISKEAFLEYLTYLSPIAPRTIFEGIFKLPPGHTLRFSNGVPRVERWYDLVEKTAAQDVDEAEAIRISEKLLSQSVDYRMVSDVEVGTFLSGGIDSSLISSMVKRKCSGDLHTFSIGYDEYEQFDECGYARTVAESIGSIHHEVKASRNDFLDSFDSVIHHLGEPVNDSACIPTFILSKHVKDAGIKVMLTGEGSDEQFIGYDHYFNILKYESLRKTASYDFRNLISDYPNDSYNITKNWEYLRRMNSDFPIFRTTGECFTKRQLELLLNLDMFEDLNEDMLFLPLKSLRESVCGKFGNDHLRWMSNIDFRIWIGDVLNTKVDRMTMAHGIEARAPFLDHTLVETVLGFPSKITIGRRSKHLLKSVAEKYVPEEIVERKKKGFSSPYLYWFYDGYGEGVLELLRKANSETGYFNDDFLTFLYNEGKNGKFAQNLWGLILFSRWFEITYMGG